MVPRTSGRSVKVAANEEIAAGSLLCIDENGLARVYKGEGPIIGVAINDGAYIFNEPVCEFDILRSENYEDPDPRVVTVMDYTD